MSEHEPGTLAVVTAEPFHGPLRTEQAWLGPDGCWHFVDGHAVHSSRDDLVSEVRPLAVIDPESYSDLTLLAQQYLIAKNDYMGQSLEFLTKPLRAALREFANPTPPKPEEPTGLGAVVEDAEGDLWIRTCQPCDNCLDKPWQRGPVRKNWLIVTAVRVLSEGVTA